MKLGQGRVGGFTNLGGTQVLGEDGQSLDTGASQTLARGDARGARTLATAASVSTSRSSGGATLGGERAGTDGFERGVRVR
jgi:hypothetical protein